MDYVTFLKCSPPERLARMRERALQAAMRSSAPGSVYRETYGDGFVLVDGDELIAATVALVEALESVEADPTVTEARALGQVPRYDEQFRALKAALLPFINLCDPT